jgi:polyphosphate kinase
MVAELYRASMAGVDVDLVVRDICRLRPGIEGLSETVDVYSIVDRFLEHSRIFYFENGGDPEYYLGSADWMTRNLDNRVEAVAPVTDTDIREQLRFILELCLRDNRSAWTMNADGTYDQRTPDEDEPVVSTQDVLMACARAAHETGDDRGIVPEHPAVETDLLLDGRSTRTGTEAGDGTDSGPNRSDETDAGSDDAAADARADGDDLPGVLGAHPDRWYVPDSERYDFAVRTPDGDRAYRKTADAAAALVERYWSDKE